MAFYSIKNAVLTAQFNSFGAELSSLKHQDGFEFIWQANQDVWPRHAPILFPIVGRLKNQEYVYEGSTYPMNQHGFARDLEFQLLQRSEHSITFILNESDETLKQYPFRFQLLMQYRLEKNQLHQTFIVINRDHEVMPTSFGAHPAFRLDDISEYELIFEKKETTASLTLEDGLIGEKQRSGVTEGRIRLTPNTFDEDALIFNDLTSSEVQLKHVSNNHSVTVSFPQFPYLGVWSKPHAPFVCIEPWHGIADPKFHSGNMEEKAGMLWLEPGKKIEKSFTMTFEH